jgi:hypothetical protein
MCFIRLPAAGRDGSTSAAFFTTNGTSSEQMHLAQRREIATALAKIEPLKFENDARRV